MFNRSQRNVLNQLSEDLFGSSSKWQRLLDGGAFRVNQREEKVNTQKYVSSQKDGTVMRAETALFKGIITPEYYDSLETVAKVGDRPTFEELVQKLNELKELRDSNASQPKGLITV